MIRSSCKLCGTIHTSDQAHVGKYLKCAGCGKPVYIESTYVRKNASEIVIPASASSTLLVTMSQRTHALWRSLARSLDSNKKLGFATIALAILLLSIARYLHVEKNSWSLPPKSAVSSPLPYSSTVNATSATNKAKSNYRSTSDDAGKPWDYYRVAAMQPRLPEAAKLHPLKHLPKLLSVAERPYAPVHSNGERLDDGSQLTGHSKFDVSNHKDLDAVVIMVDVATGTTSAKLYLRRQGDGEIDKINPGTNDIRVTEGLDWNDNLGEFEIGAEYSKFPAAVTFKESDDGIETVFDHVSVTLHTVHNGNIKRVRISKAEFWPHDMPEHVR